MNKIIFVSVLLVASLISPSIRAEENEHNIEDCIKEFLDTIDNAVVPEEIEKIAQTLRNARPGANLTDILEDKNLVMKNFIEDDSELGALKYDAMRFSIDLFDTLSENSCIDDVQFQEYMENLEFDTSNPNQAKVQKVNDYMRLCAKIQSIGEEEEVEDF